MEPHWHILSDLGTILKPSWGHLGPSWRHLGPSWGHLDLSWSLLGSSWSHLGPSWRRLGAILGHLGAILAHLGAILAHLGASLAHLGGFLAHLGGVLEPSWAILGPSWGHLGAQAPPGAKKHCKIRVKVHLEVTTPARDAPEVDFDLCLYTVFCTPDVLSTRGGICARLGFPGRECKGGEHSLQASRLQASMLTS